MNFTDRDLKNVFWGNALDLTKVTPTFIYMGMETFPKNLAEFERCFLSEQNC